MYLYIYLCARKLPSFADASSGTLPILSPRPCMLGNMQFLVGYYMDVVPHLMLGAAGKVKIVGG